MYSDDEIDNDETNRKDSEFKLERFLNRSQFYFDRLPILKTQLNDINRFNQPDLYIEKLNEIDTIIHDLAENIRNIEQLYLQLNENERFTLDHQVRHFRIEIDREMNEFHRLREQYIALPSENTLSINETNDNNNSSSIEENTTSNQLRQRHVTTNRLNDSYDLLEQDLAHLREAIDEVATIIAQQDKLLSRTEQIKNIAQYRVRNVSSLFQKAIHNRYITIASGALLGATIGGPVGFMMGAKAGTLVALSGSAVGALSMNIMQQRASENEESEYNTTAYNQAML
ncbi:unnamed protein product [Adineta steineri]|uniref:STX17-like N-terminal domain-containing protein n=1 Tax=Adineta steineri TaxID=433720 RepID=A0A813PCF6_9BILA|nr:unnamed protein product [Adineta steineri]CAF0861592.1 unnamed protein product [Adineta steineri]